MSFYLGPTSEIVPLTPVPTSIVPLENPFTRQNKEIMAAAQAHSTKEKPSSPGPKAENVKYLFSSFDSRHSDACYQTDEDFVNALLDDQDEEEFGLLKTNIVSGRWVESNQAMLDSGMARDIGRWQEGDESGAYRVWSEYLGYMNGSFLPHWRIYYQRFETSSIQAIAQIMKGKNQTSSD